ncbi:hypothetical protein HPB50_002517 [Hyalomma asiaticum]|uniref:Uncharacterized protein n=1 Tax=Hyalomma asiaticum TaxID=266040 RepID=A0ACB7SAY2_HYAAI|nr:hypothetical protein HPB50_002517 [Hyalomma asiaticum]
MAEFRRASKSRPIQACASQSAGSPSSQSTEVPMVVEAGSSGNPAKRKAVSSSDANVQAKAKSEIKETLNSVCLEIRRLNERLSAVDQRLTVMDQKIDAQNVGGCSDCSFQDSCCCCCCCCRLVDHRTQGAMVVMQCVQLGGASGPLLPMGTLVTALYRHRDWVCVQTPHGVRGFVRHGSCAPLGTLLAPNTGRRSRSSDNLTLRRNLHPHPVHDKFYLEKNIDTFGGSQDSRAIHTANASNVC